MGVTKLGSGALVLGAAADTYTGSLTVANGSVSVSSWNTKTAASGPLGNTNGQTAKRITLGSANTSGTILYMGGFTVLDETGMGLNVAPGGGTINLTTASTLLEIGHSGTDGTVLNGTSQSVQGTGGITGSGPLTVSTANTTNGSRFITSGGSNTFSGPVTISELGVSIERRRRHHGNSIRRRDEWSWFYNHYEHWRAARR